MTPRLLTLDEAAAQLRCSSQALRRLVRQGLLPVVRINGRVRCIRQEDVDRFVRDRVVLTGAPASRRHQGVVLRAGERLWD